MGLTLKKQIRYEKKKHQRNYEETKYQKESQVIFVNTITTVYNKSRNYCTNRMKLDRYF